MLYNPIRCPFTPHTATIPLRTKVLIHKLQGQISVQPRESSQLFSSLIADRTRSTAKLSICVGSRVNSHISSVSLALSDSPNSLRKRMAKSLWDNEVMM
jgi:hypothetical protein